MAYVDGKWLAYDERAERIEKLKRKAAVLIKAAKKGLVTQSQKEEVAPLKAEISRLERVHRGETDVLYFAMEYFSADGNASNLDNLIPSGVNYDNAADFHRDLCDLLNDIAAGRKDKHVAWACPRQHAKTAYLSNIFLVHQTVYRLKRYIVLFSETTDVAGDFITWGRYQLKLNTKLREDFGELLDVRPSKNEADNKYEFITNSGTKVEGKGLGTQTRGLRHGASRPDLFILDDLESKDSVNTPDLIAKSKAWFREEMLPALAKNGLCVYLGTILCYDSLLDYVLRERRDFERKKFSAVKSWATHQDLWQQWREIYRKDEQDSAEQALAFFKANEAKMLEGTEILWGEYWSYYDFAVLLEESGTKAFNQEYQNEPTDEERQIFKPEYFTYYLPEELRDKNLKFYGAVDPAMGKEKGDFSVIVTLAKNVDTGNSYLVDVFMDRVHPDVLIQETVKRAIEYQWEVVAVESQAAQEFIAHVMREELNKRGYPATTRLKEVKQKTRKALRIEALLPDIQAGKIRFRKMDSTAIQQFELYPMHKHDDFPDAVAMAYGVTRSTNVEVATVRSGDRWNTNTNGRRR